MESWSCTEVSRWLQENKVAENVCETFEDELIDGAAFVELTESDVRSLVKPLGQVKLIIRLIKAKQATEDSVTLGAAPSRSPPGATPIPLSPLASGSTVSVRSPDLTDYDGSVSADSNVQNIKPLFRNGVPVNYTLPKAFSKAVMNSLERKSMEPTLRSAFARELVVHMTSYGEIPTDSFCAMVARRIVLKYPFLRDASGNGYASWELKLKTRVGNKQKAERNRDVLQPPTKKRRVDDRYPPVDTTNILDEEAHKRNLDALEKELGKSTPLKGNVLQLMEETFGCRRQFVLCDAKSVKEVLQLYPALSRPDVIVQEMELILKRPKGSLVSDFQSKWQKYVPAILELAATYSKKTQRALKLRFDYQIENDPMDNVQAIFCMSAMFTVLSKKDKEKRPECYWFEVYEMSDVPEMCAIEEPTRNSPRIGRFQSPSVTEYYLFIEQQVFMKVTSLTTALLVWFISHYVFNLEYNKYYQNPAMFFQEFIFNLPESGHKKKSQCYLTAASELQRVVSKM